MGENLINVVDPITEEVGSISKDEALKWGYQEASPEQVTAFKEQQQFTTPGQRAMTAAESAASAATFGISKGVQKAFGANPENIEKREKYNPAESTVGSVVGLGATAILPGVGEAAEARAAVKGANEALEAAKILKEPAKILHATEDAKAAAEFAKQAINPLSAQSIMSGTAEKAVNAMGLDGLSAHAARGAIETAMFQTGDEIGKTFEDPHRSLGAAAANIGLAGLIGAPIGAAIGKAGDLWDAKFGGKLGQFIEDFNSRAKEHLNNPDPVGILSEELHNRYTTDKAVFDEVYGPEGLKAEAIQKLLPTQLSDKMVGSAQDFLKQANHFSIEMERNPDLYPRNLAARFNKDLRIFSDQLSQPATPEAVFNGLQEFKQRLQQNYGGQFVPKVDPSHDFIQGVRNLGSQIRSSLEDTSAWGKAAEVQQDINKAFSEYAGGKQSPLKQFEAKFTAPVGVDRVIDPGKIQTYLNQTGKAGQKIKQEMLGNYLEASENYRNAINKTHSRLGVESPLAPSSLSYTKSTLSELTPGAQLADALVKKGLNRLAGESLGTAAGAGVGHLFGQGWIGALIGEHALAPFISSVLPSLVKPMLESPTSPMGFKKALEFGLNVIKGESIINKGVKGLFKAGQEVIPTKLIPSEKETAKLDKIVKSYQEDPHKLLDVGGEMPHYLPNHGQSLSQYAMSSTNYINSQRPQPQKLSPLDKEIEPTKAQEAQFGRTLTIAEQPLMILQHIKDGTLTAKDMQDFKAIHPQIYPQLTEKLMTEMNSHLSDENKIPYKTRMGLSLFLGQPLDSTLTPGGILSTQATFQQNASPTQQAPQARGGRAHSMQALSKLGEIERTPQTARQIDRSKV